MTPARAGQASGFERCCMKGGGFDGINREYYFQRVEEMDGPAGSSLWGFSFVRGEGATESTEKSCMEIVRLIFRLLVYCWNG